MTLARLGGMREAVSLAIIGSAALVTLAVAGTAVVHDATQRTAKERGELDASINRIVTEQVARRDEIYTSPAATAAKPSSEVAAKAPEAAKAPPDIMQPPRTPEARKEAARHRDPQERAEREARAATAVRHTRKRSPAVTLRPDRILPDAFLSIRKLAFGVLR